MQAFNDSDGRCTRDVACLYASDIVARLDRLFLAKMASQSCNGSTPLSSLSLSLFLLFALRATLFSSQLEIQQLRGGFLSARLHLHRALLDLVI